MVRRPPFLSGTHKGLVSGTTAAITNTTSTKVIDGQAGKWLFITQIVVSNAHATVGTEVAIQNGNGGATIYTIPAAPLHGGAVVSFPVPLKVPNCGGALYAACITTGASVKVSASGYASEFSH